MFEAMNPLSFPSANSFNTDLILHAPRTSEGKADLLGGDS